MIHFFLKFHVRHERFSFYGPRKSDEGADTDLIYNFCWPKAHTLSDDCHLSLMCN